MSRRCAFCHNAAESGEHLWDNWINEELPKKTRFDAKRRLSGDAEPIKFVTVGLKEKLLVVCTKCNNGWMSVLTGKVKAHFSQSILNGAPFSLSPTDAVLLATFAFMKATVKDYCYGDKPFFTGDIRKRLRMSFTIPPLVRMWFAAYQGLPQYSFISNFYRVSVDRAGSANLDRGLGGRSVLAQPKMAGKRRSDEQTTTQEPYGGVQVEGGFGGDPGREDAFRAGRAV